MVGAVSGAVLGAFILGAAVRYSALHGSGVASPGPAGHQTDGRSRAEAPVSPGATLTSTEVPPTRVGDQSLASATQFVSEWFRALNRAVSSGDTSRLAAMSAKGCVACARAQQVVQEAYRGGGTLRGGTYEVRSVGADSFWSPSHPVVQVVFDRSPRTSVTAAATVRSTLPGTTFATCQLVLTWDPHGWRVREVLARTSIA